VTYPSRWTKSPRSDRLLGTTYRPPIDVRAHSVGGIQVHRLALCRAKKIGLVPSVALPNPLMEFPLGPIGAGIEKQLGLWVKGAKLIHNARFGREGISLASLRAAVARDMPFVLTPVYRPRWAGRRYRVFSDTYRSADMLLALTSAEERMLEDLCVQERRIRITGVGPILASRASPAVISPALQPLVAGLARDMEEGTGLGEGKGSRVKRLDEAHLLIHGRTLSPRHRLPPDAHSRREC
jgi:hypothetical protein